MLITVKNPPLIQLTSLIEKRVSELCKVKEIPLTRYLAAHHACGLLGIPIEQIESELITSKSLHGVKMPDGEILVHRESVFLTMRKKMKKIIEKDLGKGSLD